VESYGGGGKRFPFGRSEWMNVEITNHSGNLSSNVDSDECMGIRLRNRA